MWRVLTAGALLLLVVALGTSVSLGAGQGAASRTAPATVAPMKPHVGPLPALPRVSYQPSRPMAIVQQVYEFAARHPEVLKYVPCYCGCERIGHDGNHACFVRSRSTSGQVLQWDEHGIGCAVCLDVGRDAMTLFGGGATPRQIRAAIDKKYGSVYPSSTPTPQPR